MNEEVILKLKKLNAAYIASLEYDVVPEIEGPDGLEDIKHSCPEFGISDEDLRSALKENQGSSPRNMIDEISDLIKELEYTPIDRTPPQQEFA